MENALTIPEHRRLSELIEVVNRGLKSFCEVGTALLEIRGTRLYRETHDTFEAFCREQWGMSKTHANRMIESSKVVENLTPIGVIPANIEQTRPLYRLDTPKRIIAWQRAVETAPEGKVTAAHVQKVVNEMVGKETKAYHLNKDKPAPQPQIPEHAIYFATIAISQLERISDDDPTKEKALRMVEDWIKQKRIGGNKK